MTVNLNAIKLKTQTLHKRATIQESSLQDIAIIGMSGIFPQSANIDEFWERIVQKKSSSGDLPENRKRDIENYLRFKGKWEKPQYIKASYLSEIDTFDYKFFNVPPREAGLMSPVQRLFYQTAWSALEDAGYGGTSVKGSKTGVYLGYISDLEGYKYRQMITDVEDRVTQEIATTGNLSAITASRISYRLDLKGPSMLVDAACSSSLVALHVACHGLRNNDCDMALVGGVRLNILPIDDGFKTGIESPDGITKTFDEDANGTALGEGVVAILVKPLVKAEKDKDHIYAVIKGSAINQDGTSMGITAPNAKAQKDLLVQAWKNARIRPENLDYIEAHGTGTQLGDPIELDGIIRGFRQFTDKKGFCAVNSVKSNIGHLYDISGMAGLMKAVLALKNKTIPPGINFNVPNKQIRFEDSPVYVNDQPKPWLKNHEKRLCGVSSFGFSGTNCHIVLEEYRKNPVENDKDAFAGPLIFPLSAFSETALNNLLIAYKAYFKKEKQVDLKALCSTLSRGRTHFSNRIAILANSVDELKATIGKIDLGKPLPPKVYMGLNLKIGDRSKADILHEETGKTLENLSGLTHEDICKEYVRGTHIHWEKIYPFKNKISLPTYPFEKSRCWLDIPKAKSFDQSFFHQLNWKKIPKIESGSMLDNRKHTTVLHDKSNWFNKLKNSGILSGATFIELGAEQYQQKLVQALSRSKEQQRLMVIPDHFNDIHTVYELKRYQKENLIELHLALQTTLNTLNTANIEIDLITSGAYKITDHDSTAPHQAAISSYFLSLEKEQSNITCKILDVDEESSVESCLKWLSVEKNKLAAVRNNAFYIKELSSLDIETPTEPNISLSSEGIYVITGGAGGIGLEMARYLASKKKNIAIALVGRSAFHTNGSLPNKKWQKVNEEIATLKKEGTTVKYFQVDVSHPKSVINLVKNIKEEFGKINGVVHCAGLSIETPAIEKTAKAFESVLAPKIYGTYNLYESTKDEPLDFFLLFSSVASVFPAPLQSDYAAANAYLDAFAENHPMVKSLNWVFWKETGMASDKAVVSDTLFNALSNREAIRCIDQLIRTHHRNIMVGKINYQGGFTKVLENSSYQMGTTISDTLAWFKKKKTENPPDQQNISAQVKLVGGDQSVYSEIELKIASICKKILGFDEINISESFFDLGADSILLTRIYKLLDQEYPGKLTIAKVFAHPSIAALAGYLSQQISGDQTKMVTAGRKKASGTNDIAIIGMAVKLPRANTLDAFWEMVSQGRDCIGKFPEQRQADAKNFIRSKFGSAHPFEFQQAAYLDEIDTFDYRLFRLSPREASLMDPNQRLFLQTAMSAIEDAGYGGNKLNGSKTGVFLGFSKNSNCEYIDYVTLADPNQVKSAIPANLTSLIPSRIAYLMNLRGPSMIIDTACSSAMVSVHEACKALRDGECDHALAGGVKLKLLPIENDVKIGIESSDFHTRPFDNSSDGTGMGEGVAAILLKPLDKALEDNDSIYSVIKGSAINQDGTSVGITAPNGQAQTELLVEAWTSAGIDPEHISYIEAHGTGTKLGDPIEIESLQEAFAQFTPKKNFCAISSVKSNIGHLLECAGIVGIIKASLSLQKEKLAPNNHFNTPNHRINFEDTALFVNDRLIPWKKNGESRKCGVSSFGFSGTNCHVVLEEAPENTPVKNEMDKGPDILTLSAKTEEQVRKIAGNYLAHIQQNPNISLHDLCYTANTGRGQLEYRLVIFASNLEQLALQLEQASHGEFTNEGLHYKSFKIVDESKKQLEPGEITDTIKRQKNQEAEAILGRTSQTLSGASLKEIAQLYLKGADIHWEKLYTGQNPKRLHLPVYPFEKNRCWVKEIPPKETIHKATTYIHPLLERCAVKTIDQDIYVTDYKVETHFSLSDHKVLGDYVIPGANYPEVAKQVSLLYYGDVAIELRELSFFMPVFCKEGETRSVQNIVKQEEDHLQLTVMSQPDSHSEEWVKHASVKIFKLEKSRPSTFNIEELKAECSKELRENIDVNALTHGFFEYGPRWENYHTLRIGEQTALAEFEFPKTYRHELDTYYLHPGLIDMSIGAWALTLNKKYVPLAYKSYKVIGPTPAKYYSYLKRKEIGGEDAEVIRYDVALIGEDGVAFGEITDFAIKKADRFKDIAVDSQYVRVSWKTDSETVVREGESKKPVLVFADEAGLYKKIIQTYPDAVCAEIGSGFKAHPNNHFTIGNSQEDYDKLLAIAAELHVQQIIHLSGISQQENTDIHQLEESLDKGARSLLRLSKAMVNNKISSPIHLAVVTHQAYSVLGSEAAIYPEGASGLAMAKVMENELSHVRATCIDVDKLPEDEDEITRIINLPPGLYAYRNDVRYRGEIDSFDIETVENQPVEIKKEGAYLITGGASGIGKEIAAFLAGCGSVNLCLTGRTQIPVKQKWETVKGNNGDAKAYKIIQALKELEAKGATVWYDAVDVADLQQMQNLRDKIVDKFGKINGIVHSAGVAGDGFMMHKDEAAFNKVISPKIKGAWVLDTITLHDHPDFFINFSSIASILCLPGQSDYTAANAYLDAFAAYRKTKGKPALTINWPAWKETGMAVEHQMNIDTLFKAMPTFKGIHLFEAVLNKNLPNIILGEVNYTIFNDEGIITSGFLDHMQYRLGKNIKNHRKKLKTPPKNKTTKPAQVRLKGKSETPYSDVEMCISALWGEVLGLEEMDVHTNFFDLGGDSIIATQLQRRIEEEFPGVLDITDVFSYATVYKMSEYIKEKTAPTEPNQPVALNTATESADLGLEGILSQLENGELSVEDAEQLL